MEMVFTPTKFVIQALCMVNDQHLDSMQVSVALLTVKLHNQLFVVSIHVAVYSRKITAFSYLDHISRNRQLVCWLFNDAMSCGDVTVLKGIEDY
jgi:hypothetical protein